MHLAHIIWTSRFLLTERALGDSKEKNRTFNNADKARTNFTGMGTNIQLVDLNLYVA